MQNTSNDNNVNTNKPLEIDYGLCKVASLNLLNYACPPACYYQLEENYSALEWQQKSDWLDSLLKQIKPDIIAFQEVFTANSLKELTCENGLPHFATIEDATPCKDSEFVLIKPVVAVASHFPILKLETVVIDPKLLTHLKLPLDFEFSRKPLKAHINIPHMGTIRLYIVHLKSKRHTNMVNYTQEIQPDNETYQYKVKSSIGKSHSKMQRCLEGLFVYHDLILEQAKHPLPTLIMGDFNDSLHDTDLEFLINNDKAENLDRTLDLYDARELSCEDIKRSPTLYFEGEGKVIDYILVSNELNTNNKDAVIKELKFETLDKHIKPEHNICHKNTSDHACIYIEFSFPI